MHLKSQNRDSAGNLKNYLKTSKVSLCFWSGVCVVVFNLSVRLRGRKRRQKAVTEVTLEEHARCGPGDVRLKKTQSS